ncbi:HIPA PROTEIN [uncultured Candidatus Thioglobus sp.]|nr:HIPA PROTEIN [uncultured Candidatus Thioglobus sp.]
MPSLDYDDLLGLTFHLTKELDELLKMYRLACFNLFAYNRDDHAKNFSFLLDNNHKWKLSPAYDLTFSYGPSGEHSTTYLGEGKNPSERQLLDLAKKHSIKNAQKIIDEVKIAVKCFANYAKEFDISKHLLI